MALAQSGDVALVAEAAAADVILFAEWNGDEPDGSSGDDIDRVLASPEFRRHPEKTVVHSGKDAPRPLIAGLYPSLTERWARALGCQGAPYLNEPNPFLTQDVGWDGRFTQLASFFGHCAEKRVRLKLVAEARAAKWQDVAVRDTSAEFIATLRSGDASGHNALKREFVRDLLGTKFALCPEGTGLSSFRLFEAMQVGRAPVMIADGWAPPPGPDWDAFLIRVPERHIAALPAIVREHEAEWQTRGQKAQEAWRAFYSPGQIGPTVARQAFDVVASQSARHVFASALANVYVYGPRKMTQLRQRLARKLERAFAG